MINVKVKKVLENVELPEYATDGSGCFDLRGYFSLAGDGTELHRLIENHLLGDFENESRKFETFVFRTGLAFEIPKGHVMLIFSRSGHGFKHDTRLANCVGVIDSDYRGEVKIKLTYDGRNAEELVFRSGDRIAQGMIIPAPEVSFEEAEELSDTVRGENGFGSTDNG